MPGLLAVALMAGCVEERDTTLDVAGTVEQVQIDMPPEFAFEESATHVEWMVKFCRKVGAAALRKLK